jgi:steroid 5-alpha reductase family enzyme
MSLIELLVLGTVATSAGMASLWFVATRIDNYGIVDVGWTASFTMLAILYAAVTDAAPARAALVLGTASIWSLRLTLYLHRRVMGHHPVEDTRYQDLRRSWGRNLRFRMFWFFQAQAVAAVFFSLPFAITLLNPDSRLGLLEGLGVAIWAVGVIGEGTADRQLSRFKADPRHQGQICQVGLWRYSRHPNYFFEWIVWCGFATIALGAPNGWLAVACPLVMLYLLLGLTGIPATEAAAVARRGDAYRRYQRTTSAFVPWYPSQERR